MLSNCQFGTEIQLLSVIEYIRQDHKSQESIISKSYGKQQNLQTLVKNKQAEISHAPETCQNFSFYCSQL